MPAGALSKSDRMGRHRDEEKNGKEQWNEGTKDI